MWCIRYSVESDVSMDSVRSCSTHGGCAWIRTHSDVKCMLRSFC